MEDLYEFLYPNYATFPDWKASDDPFDSGSKYPLLKAQFKAGHPLKQNSKPITVIVYMLSSSIVVQYPLKPPTVSYFSIPLISLRLKSRCEPLNNPNSFFLKLIGPNSSYEMKIDLEDQYHKWKKYLQQRMISLNFDFDFISYLPISTNSLGFTELDSVSTQKPYFAKFIHSSKIYSSNKGRSIVTNEIDVLRIISHRHCPAYIATYINEDSVVHIFQNFSLTPLDKINELECKNIMSLMGELIDLISYFQRQGIINRKICPSNIAVDFTYNGEVFKMKLLDMGCTEYINSKTNLVLCRCGTPGYIAPEVLQSTLSTSPSTLRSCDVYSLGLIFYELLTGTRAYGGKSAQEQYKNNESCIFNRKLLIEKHIHDLAIDLCNRMTENNPVQRISSDEASKHPYFDDSNACEMGMMGEIQESIPCLQELINKGQKSYNWGTIKKINDRIEAVTEDKTSEEKSLLTKMKKNIKG